MQTKTLQPLKEESEDYSKKHYDFEKMFPSTRNVIAKAYYDGAIRQQKVSGLKPLNSFWAIVSPDNEVLIHTIENDKQDALTNGGFDEGDWNNAINLAYRCIQVNVKFEEICGTK